MIADVILIKLYDEHAQHTFFSVASEVNHVVVFVENDGFDEIDLEFSVYVELLVGFGVVQVSITD